LVIVLVVIAASAAADRDVAGAMATLAACKRRWPSACVLMLDGAPSVTDAVRAMQAGAWWYGGAAPTPELTRAIRDGLARVTTAPCADADGRARGLAFGAAASIVGRSEAIGRVLKQAALVAPTRTTVLLLGETGTGKERLAQAIHDASPRRRGPFVAVNCAALAETLLESELFGHEKGAFSGAHARREGRFKAADGGTIFLDEIGETSATTQVKLLRVLQERKFERVGGNQTLTVDVRIIAATNRNLREMVERRSFRADLFYRLNVMAVQVPPLRDRREDIPLLVDHMLPRLAADLGLPEATLAPEAMERLLMHDWPGNVRELENVLERALVMAQGNEIHVVELPEPDESLSHGAVASGGIPSVPGASFREIERHAIMTTYEACGRSALKTAKVLGLSPRTVHYRLREYRGEPGRRMPRDEGVLDWELHVVQAAARGAGANGSEN
jgi:DNA-binding NtrC family response regulator